MKKHLIVYYGDATECVEGFGKDCKRSCKGALHVNPGRQITVTDDELAHIKSKHKHIVPKLRILSSMEEKAEPKKAEKKEEAKAEPKKEAKKEEAESKDEAQEESVTKKKRRR